MNESIDLRRMFALWEKRVELLCAVSLAAAKCGDGRYAREMDELLVEIRGIVSGTIDEPRNSEQR